MTGYTVNLLNQLTNRVNPSAVEVLGAANAQAEVRVNGLPAYRRGEYFRRELAVTNASGPAWTPVSVSAVQSGTTNTTSGNLLSPPVNEVRTNNADGNLLMDGLWIYQWDAENRLLSVTSTNTLPASARRQVRWEYDAAGRRIRETVGAWNTNQLAYTNVLDLKLIYDGWACIAELTPANGLLRQYVWGTDLSGSMTGAGGVGGLLWMKQGATAHFAAMDGNGNVMGLVDGALGDFSARYEYDTFGQTIRLTGTGTIAQDNRYRFSTKRAEPTTGLILYEYRAYDAKAGRWLNRDPIEEHGGNNLYGFVSSNPISWIDTDGRHPAGGALFGPSGHVEFRPDGSVRFVPNTPAQQQEVMQIQATAVELVIPISAAQALADGNYVAVAGEFIVGKVRILGRIPGVKAVGEKCCVKVKAVIDWFKKPMSNSGGEAIQKCSTTAGPTVTLHHSGSLKPTGQVSPNRTLSTSQSPDVGHYHPGEPIQTFEVQQEKFLEWQKTYQVEFKKDVLKGTDKVVEEIRILPPASGELNNFKK